MTSYHDEHENEYDLRHPKPVTDAPTDSLGYHGHKTMLDGSHVALTAEEAKALWDSAEAAKSRRAETMPGVEDALRCALDAQQRMQELGWWQGGGMRVKRGEDCAVAEFGSTGIWRGWIDDEGKYVHYADCVADPRRAWLKPLADLTDAERHHMAKCDASAAAYTDRMLAAYAAEEPAHE